MLDKYPNDVKVVQKNFPLKFHKLAKPAAIAALAAGAQGKYWEYHDKVMENHSKLSDAKFLEFATELGLDVEAFKKSLTDPKHQQAVNKDLQDGSKAGVTGTPSIFVAGRRLNDRSLNGISAIIDSELKKKKK